MYKQIREELRPQYRGNILYERYFKEVYEKIIYLLAINGVLIKIKGDATFPKDLFVNLIDTGLQIITGRDNSKANKQTFKDLLNLLSFHILDDYNNKETK